MTSPEHGTNPTPSPSPDPTILALQVDTAPQVNFACQQNSVPVIRTLHIHNPTTRSHRVLTLEMRSSPAFITPKRWNIDQVTQNSTLEISDRDTRLDGDYLLNLREAQNGELIFRLLDETGQPLAEHNAPIQVLARNEWGGYGNTPELLAAFSMPNEPAVETILRAASDILRKSGEDGTLLPYDKADPERIWLQASAIWSALLALRLDYAYPPSSFERTGQKIRTPNEIYDSRRATCLDTTMLFASLLEQARLNPLVILDHGHAYVGLWLKRDTMPRPYTEDLLALRKRVQLNEIIVIETTLLAKNSTFSAATKTASHHLSHDGEAAFVGVLDISRARDQRIHPLSYATANQELTPAPDASSDPALPVTTLEKPTADQFLPPDGDWNTEAIQAGGRLGQWQRKLLDLTLRNPLLKMRHNRRTLHLIAPDPGRLEDLLSQGKKFSIESAPGYGTRDEKLHTQRTGENLDDAIALKALERNTIYVQDDPDSLTSSLVELYRKARNDLEEGGSNTLYLAVGILNWQRPGARERTNSAPLILIPVTITRQSVRSGIKIALSDDEPRFNTTLLEMLRQDFGLRIDGLDGDLPTDESGTDIPAIITRVRQEIRDIPGFEVREEVYLSTFSFAKYLMWKDLVDRTDQLKQNPVVKHLIENPREPFHEAHDFVDPRDLDDTIPPNELYTPLSLDSSQLAAVVAGAAGKNFVMIGPPGTGKSQTISNMIAHNLGLGRTVLFVSEKAAALNVVYRRLQAIGLGEFCLELHSNKARKLDVIRQLGKAWEVTSQLSPSEWEHVTSRLKLVRDDLNELVRTLHHIHPNGLTVRQALGTAAGNPDTPQVALTWPTADHHDRPAYENLLAIGERLELNAAQLGPLHDHPLAIIHTTQWSTSWQSDILQSASALSEKARAYRDAVDQFTHLLDLPPGNHTAPRLATLSALAKTLLDCASRDMRFAFSPAINTTLETLTRANQLLAQFTTAEKSLSCKYTRDKLLAADITAPTRLWNESKQSWWLIRILKQRQCRKLLQQQFGATGRPDPETDIPHITAMQAHHQDLDTLTPHLTDLPGWRGLDSDTTTMDLHATLATALRKSMAELASTSDVLITLRAALEKIVIHGNELLTPTAATGIQLTNFLRTETEFRDTLSTFATHANRNPDDLLQTTTALEQLCALSTRITDAQHRLNAWCAWRRVRAEAVQAGLLPLVTTIENQQHEPTALTRLIEVNFARWWVRQVIDATPVLRNFVSVEHDRKIQNFCQLDEQVRNVTSQYIRTRIRTGLVSKDDVKRSSEYGIIRRELEKKTRHKPLRQLISEAPTAIPTLTPCLLMSPLSIAQYLPVDQKPFDVVIFDEASQITVWDAIGAIARGQQAIVVGDPKQLPPTSFFDATQAEDDTDPEEDLVEDLESILDEMLGSNMPTVNLNWHYRSRHESLITFSNQRYYNSNLVTFPSPITHDKAVSLTYVGGIYDRGASQTNRVEADAIVTEILNRLKSHDTRNQTLGVVTFNQKQQNLILDLLEKARQDDPDLDQYFAEDLIEPIFVKNLEAVQGDERDVILFSTTFGPDRVGRTSMNFGPINNSGGERRLNVAITRARIELKVITSLRPDQIDLNRTAAIGVRDLKHFLEFAERGPRALDEATFGSLGDFESPLETAVANQLRERGWTVQPQVGVSRFRIDLGIVHPNAPGAYLAGIECDGATYHSSATARDRDLVRESVLRGLGWNILRLWSTDYWINPHDTIEKLHTNLQTLLTQNPKT